VTQHNYASGTRLVVALDKPAANRQSNTQHRQQRCGHLPHGQTFGLADAGERHLRGTHRRDGVERLTAIAPVDVVLVGHGNRGRERRSDLVQDDDFVRTVVRQRRQKYGFDDGKDGGICANADGERQNRRNRE
jgi:hypothetical protein